MANEYKQTMNLPKTKFPMRAALASASRSVSSAGSRTTSTSSCSKKNEGHEKFVLHDGPPYANGPIHLGHAMNKIAKDMINRYKAMQGYETPYVPGWDCHGQPIEHKVETQMGTEKFNQASTAEIRELCNKFAVENIDPQREGFKRLGVLGDWDNPYLTLYHQHDAADIEAFKAMYDRGRPPRPATSRSIGASIATPRSRRPRSSTPTVPARPSTCASSSRASPPASSPLTARSSS